jgi:hypothetical protein
MELRLDSIVHKLRVIAETLEFNDDEDEEPYGLLIGSQIDQIEEVAKKRISEKPEEAEYAESISLNADAMLALVGYYRNNQLAVQEIKETRKRLKEWGLTNFE